MTKSEKLLSAFSQMYFFEELVQDHLHFISDKGETQELADLILNLGSVVVAIQIKERSEVSATNDNIIEQKWLINKLNKAKKQLKNTINFIKSGNLPMFLNKRGMEVPIHSDAEVIPLVVFMNDAISKYPYVLGKHTDGGLTTNCMSYTDFQIMCQELISPAEIVDYLRFRCEFYEKNGFVDIMIFDASETEMLLTRPTANETLVYQFIAERYGISNIQKGKEQVEIFRWFIQQTAERSLIGRDNYATYAILLFLAHFRRDEIEAFWERLLIAKNKAKEKEYDIVGSLRREEQYAIFFVASPPQQALPMDYLLEKVRMKCNPSQLLQVYVWWEDEKNYHIDYLLWDKNTGIS